MVYNYDIYYKTGPKSAQSYRITKNAVPGIIYNGVPDWLYEGRWLVVGVGKNCGNRKKAKSVVKNLTLKSFHVTKTAEM